MEVPITDEALSVMPPFVTACAESVSFNENRSRWTERSHYVGQIVATILAFVAFIPSSQTAQPRASMTGEIRGLGAMQNAVMYRSDEHAVVHDEPMVHRDAPNVKPEPASLPSVRSVSAPAKVGDKPGLSRPRTQVPSFIYTAQPSANRPGNQR